jgi:D-3-phosphoglycerate dehydrogenase
VRTLIGARRSAPRRARYPPRTPGPATRLPHGGRSPPAADPTGPFPRVTPVTGVPRVLICDELAPSAVQILQARGLEVETRLGLDEAALCEAVTEFDACVVRSATKITRPVLEASTRLKAVGRAGIGVDNIDRTAATERGVVVMNTPGGNTLSTAELALTLCLSLARHIPAATRRVREGSWNKKGLMGAEMTGKTLGVVGLGRVGGLLAERALGIGMRVVAHDPYLESAGKGSPIAGVELVPFAELVPQVDFISLHVPLLDSTRGMVGAEAMRAMKNTAYIVNTSRGGVVDEAALLEALDAGEIAGAALDVLEVEPPAADNPLLTHEKVVVTPHLGASSAEAQDRVADMIAEQLADYLLDGVARNAVNMPTFGAADMQRIAPALELAERMGSFAVQGLEGPANKVEITAGGALAEFGTQAFELAVLVGVLRHVVGGGVNFVNAPLLAKERGIHVLASCDEESIYHDGHLLVRVECKEGGVQVRGALFGNEPHFTRIDGVHVDLLAEGPLLLTRHEDQPGVLGKIGTTLGEHGVNIRRVDLGLSSQRPDGLASAFLRLDRTPEREVIADLESIEPIRWVRCVHP